MIDRRALCPSRRNQIAWRAIQGAARAILALLSHPGFPLPPLPSIAYCSMVLSRLVLPSRFHTAVPNPGRFCPEPGHYCSASGHFCPIPGQAVSKWDARHHIRTPARRPPPPGTPRTRLFSSRTGPIRTQPHQKILKISTLCERGNAKKQSAAMQKFRSAKMLLLGPCSRRATMRSSVMESEVKEGKCGGTARNVTLTELLAAQDLQKTEGESYGQRTGTVDSARGETLELAGV
jgi:hypothetical protein